MTFVGRGVTTSLSIAIFVAALLGGAYLAAREFLLYFVGAGLLALGAIPGSAYLRRTPFRAPLVAGASGLVAGGAAALALHL